jgi:deoxyhypusine synthase
MPSTNAIPISASSAVLKPSDPVPQNIVSVHGPNFEYPLSLQDLLGSYERIGFQATSLGKAIDIVNRMVR